MNITISIENVLGYADSVRYNQVSYWSERAEHGYKKGNQYWFGTVKSIDDAYEWMEKSEKELSAICDITGLNYDAMLQMSRIMERYYQSDSYQFEGICLHEEDFEKLYNVLTAKQPEWDGIYRNEYTDSACEKLAQKRYENHVYEWGRW